MISHVLDSWSSFDYELNKCLNSQTWQTELNNENHAWEMKIRPKTKKNELDFIWMDFHYGSWRYKSHSVPRCISWDSIENKFLQSTMKKLVSRGSMKEKLEVWWKNAFVFWNDVRSLSFLSLKIFHTSQTSMRWKFLETRTKSSHLSKISSKLSLLVSPLALQS